LSTAGSLPAASRVGRDQPTDLAAPVAAPDGRAARPLLERDGDKLVGEHLAGHREELATLPAWSRIDNFDRAAVQDDANTARIPNYGERRRYGEAISSATVYPNSGPDREVTQSIMSAA
ncbi:hypothetical protein, partial [Frankia sp. Cr1]|uniref:hypothetical protein n=1 Tax=Frankia sp. Cr1 TaxID=3073931 RepID=UPI002AD370A7